MIGWFFESGTISDFSPHLIIYEILFIKSIKEINIVVGVTVERIKVSVSVLHNTSEELLSILFLIDAHFRSHAQTLVHVNGPFVLSEKVVEIGYAFILLNETGNSLILIRSLLLDHDNCEIIIISGIGIQQVQELILVLIPKNISVVEIVGQTIRYLISFYISLIGNNIESLRIDYFHILIMITFSFILLYLFD